MPAGILQDEDKPALNDARLASANFTGATMRLFQTLTSITHATGQAVFAANECSFAGYAAQLLTGWSSSILDAGFYGVSTAAPVTFTNSGGTSTPLITGWWYHDAATGLAIIGGLFDNPFVILAGLTYVVSPTFRINNE